MFKGITPIEYCISHTKATVQINLELLCTKCFLFYVAGTKLYRSFLIPSSILFPDFYLIASLNRQNQNIKFL